MRTFLRQPDASPARPARAGFTLIELLVVLVILALLIGILGAVFARVARDSRRAATEQYMRNLTVSIEQFNNDFGYDPPLLAPDAMIENGWTASMDPEPLDSFELVSPSAQDDPAEALRNARYMSVVSLSLYLIGMGDLAPEEFAEEDPDRHDGAAGPGLRDPGADRAWGGALERTDQTHRPARSGRVFGPYTDVGSGRNFRRIADFRALATNEQEAPADELDPDQRRFFTFEDRWGGVVRYYRAWPTRKREEPSERSIDRIPIELLDHDTVFARPDDEADFDTSMERDLLNAPYALLSAGPDGKFADTGDPAMNEEFAAGAMPETYDSGALMQPLLTEPFVKFDALLDSLEDNVRVLP